MARHLAPKGKVVGYPLLRNGNSNAFCKLEKQVLQNCDVVCATNVGAASGILETMIFATIGPSVGVLHLTV